MFREILQDIVEGTEGGTAGLLMGFDGIAVDQYSAGGEAFDVESVGMEYSLVLKSVQQAAEMLDAGTTSEVAVQTERLTTVVRFINEEFFAAVTLRPDGNLGKARFLLRVKTPDIIDNL